MAYPARLTATIEREGDGYVALCPEYDVASQGDTMEGARANLVETLTLFFECADPTEIKQTIQAGSARNTGRGKGCLGSVPCRAKQSSRCIPIELHDCASFVRTRPQRARVGSGPYPAHSRIAAFADNVALV